MTLDQDHIGVGEQPMDHRHMGQMERHLVNDASSACGPLQFFRQGKIAQARGRNARRIGIGRDPSGRDMVDHVLTRFTAEERKLMEDAVKTGADAVAAIVEAGVDKAMNTFN